MAEKFAVATHNLWHVFYWMSVNKNLEIYRNKAFANCWHINSHENSNMWENYVLVHGNEGIAIQTNFSNLVESFETDRVLTNLKMLYIN